MVKALTIVDSMTEIRALAFRPGDISRLSTAAHGNFAHAGFGRSVEEHNAYVVVMQLDPIECHYDPSAWKSATMYVAHLEIQERWHELEDGSVVDAEPRRRVLAGHPIRKGAA